MADLQAVLMVGLVVAVLVVVLNRVLRSRVLWFASGGVVTYLLLEDPGFQFQAIDTLNYGIELFRDLNLWDLIRSFV